jgi:hypothetical protein
MNRRILFPLAAGIVGLVAISPALATESKKDPGKSSAPAKATTTSSDPGDSADQGNDPSDQGNDPSDQGNDPSTDSSSKNGSTGNSSPGSDSGSGGQRSSSVCDPPETDQGPAPQMGDAAQTHEAGEAGSVDVERLSDTELRVAQASPNDGWTEQVATPSGPRITVKFTRQGQSPSLIRFAASMDQKGTMIHVRVTNCG